MDRIFSPSSSRIILSTRKPLSGLRKEPFLQMLPEQIAKGVLPSANRAAVRLFYMNLCILLPLGTRRDQLHITAYQPLLRLRHRFIPLRKLLCLLWILALGPLQQFIDGNGKKVRNLDDFVDSRIDRPPFMDGPISKFQFRSSAAMVVLFALQRFLIWLTSICFSPFYSSLVWFGFLFQMLCCI